MSLLTILHNAKIATNAVPAFVEAVAFDSQKISTAYPYASNKVQVHILLQRLASKPAGHLRVANEALPRFGRLCGAYHTLCQLRFHVDTL
jgi:hypothetical protein